MCPMRHLALLAVLLLIFFGAALPVSADASGGRQRLLLDADWRFHLGDLPSAGIEPITHWRWKADERGEAAANEYVGAEVTAGNSDWRDTTTGADVFGSKPGFAWYRTVLSGSAGQDAQLHFQNVNDNATVYLNGRRLAHHEGFALPFDVPVSGVWHDSTPNVLAVLVENTRTKGWLGDVSLVRPTEMAKSHGPAAPGYPDGSWRRVHLPHDYVIEGRYDPRQNRNHAYLPTRVGWYRTTFTVPKTDAGKRLFLDFDGVYRNSAVWLNGQYLGMHSSGYIGFEYEATQAIRFGGPNVLAVRVDPRHFEGWWYEGGGIYRHVWLVKTAPLHVAHDGTFVIATVPGADKAHPSVARLSVRTTLQNSGCQGVACQLVSEVLGPDGKRVARGVVGRVVGGGSDQDGEQQFIVARPQLWSLEHPRLYHLITSLVQNGRTTDRVTTSFGIRTIRFDAERGFFLNGRHVKIQGTCNHQNFAVVGIALPDALLAWRIRKLKALGANAYRTAHDPQAAELLDACDRLGMLVMDENRHFGDTDEAKAKPGTPATDLSDLKAMVRRDRNHPSIIMWSMCNEEPLSPTPEGARIFTAMRNAVRAADPTRPVTCAMLPPWGPGVSQVEDIQGFNHGQGRIDAFHAAFPTHPTFGSEMAGAVTDRGIYQNDVPHGFVDNYSLKRTAEAAWRPTAERPFMAGTFIWTGFDYQGEPTVTSWPSIGTHFGMLDICGFPKDGASYYRAWWGDRPLVHLFPHWNWAGREGQPITVWCYGNCDRVTLLLNGKTLGTQAMPRFGHLEWSVPYAPGRLEARGYTDGRLTAHDVVETTGVPARLELAVEPMSFRANGEDLALVSVAVRDRQGRLVPTADSPLRFQVQGPATLLGTGNGNPNDHTPNAAPARQAFSGRCLAVLRATDTPGDMIVTATAPGLPPAHIRLRERSYPLPGD